MTSFKKLEDQVRDIELRNKKVELEEISKKYLK